jgi:periplasmic protein TonB
MKILITVLLLTMVGSGFTQFNSKNQPKKETEQIFRNANGERVIPAEFPGGMVKLYSFISKKVKYPKDAKIQKINGSVSVSFIIDAEGNIKKESVKVVKKLFDSCDNEAIRVIKECPRWIPAKNLETGQPEEANYIVPVTFKSI